MSFQVPAGWSFGDAACGIRGDGGTRRDVALIVSDRAATAAGMFTTNRVQAAPVRLCRDRIRLRDGTGFRGVVACSGNANACTGKQGEADALAMTSVASLACGIADDQAFLVASTGVIGRLLPFGLVETGIRKAGTSLAGTHAALDQAAQAIMTTDTQPKAISRQIRVGAVSATVSGISKGAGMIRPNMATMLSFVATDASIAPPLLQRWVRELADASFNRVTVDGDTSTNDSFILAASGAGGLRIEHETDPGARELRAALLEVAQWLAQAIVRDGEGATKFISLHIESARNLDEASAVAYAIAHSPLVKTAFFASDPNLGRILAAVGYAGITDLDVNRVDLWLDEVHVATGGGRHPAYREEDGQRVMRQSEITVRVALGRGQAATTVWTCDLSHDYVSINADYRS